MVSTSHEECLNARVINALASNAVCPHAFCAVQSSLRFRLTLELYRTAKRGIKQGFYFLAFKKFVDIVAHRVFMRCVARLQGIGNAAVEYQLEILVKKKRIRRACRAICLCDSPILIQKIRKFYSPFLCKCLHILHSLARIIWIIAVDSHDCDFISKFFIEVHDVGHSRFYIRAMITNEKHEKSTLSSKIFKRVCAVTDPRQIKIGRPCSFLQEWT